MSKRIKALLPNVKPPPQEVLDTLVAQGLLEPDQVITGQQYLDMLGGQFDPDNVQLNVLANEIRRHGELMSSLKSPTKTVVEQEDPIDIFADDIYQGEVPNTNFTLDEVPNYAKRINPNTGEIEIKLSSGRKDQKYYKPEQLYLHKYRSPTTNRIVKSFKVRFKTPSKKGDYINLGVKLADRPDVKNIMESYIRGDIGKIEAAYRLDAIESNIPNFASNQSLQRPKERFDPFLEGYISTLKKKPESVDFYKYINKDASGDAKEVGFKKINQAINVMTKLENDSFNKIKLPDGTLMKDQPLGVRMYNAFMSEPGQDMSYARFIKTYVNPYYKYKNPNAELMPDFKKPNKTGKVEGTNLIYSTAKGKRKYVIPDEYKPYFNQVKERMYAVLPVGQRERVGATYQSHVARMIGYAKEQGANPDEIIKVIQNTDAEGLAKLFTRKKDLENKVKILRDQAMSSSLKRTNPELYVDKNRKLGDFDIALIELSHIQDVADNWKAAFDLNNIFLAPGKFNRDQLYIDRRLKNALEKFSKAETFSEKKAVLKKIKAIEEELINKNLISKHGDRYFGVDKDSDIEANLLKRIEEQVDYTRYLADGGLVSFEEVLEYDYD